MNKDDFLYDLFNASDAAEIIFHWGRFNQISRDYMLIATSETYDRDIVYPEGLSNILSQSDTDFVAYFMSENIFFLDTDILQSMVQESNVKIQYDYSIMLDTNYTSYIETFIKKFNQSNFSEESVFITIDILLRNNFNYDYTFYLIENYKNLFSSGKEKFTVSNPNHLAVYENLYYLELFKNINQEKYLSSNKIEYLINDNEAKQKVDEMISTFYKNNDNLLKLFMEMHQNITLLLIGIWQIQFSSKASAKNKMKLLFEFVKNFVGIYYEREMIIALKYFEDTKSVGMLNKINKGVNQDKLLEKIENIAWDFMVPRIMEFQMNAHKVKTFFIPFFLSHDKKLKELIKLFKIKGILLHKETNEFIPISELNATQFFEEKELLEHLEMLYSKEVKEERDMVRKKNVETNFENIKVELARLSKILEKQ